MLDGGSEEVIHYQLKLNLAKAGPKLGKHTGFLQQYVQQFSPASAKKVINDGVVDIELPTGNSVQIELDDLLIEKKTETHWALAASTEFSVALHTEITAELKREGLARELIRAVQDYRKQLDLPIEQRIKLTLAVNDELKAVIHEYDELLRANLLVASIDLGNCEQTNYVSIEGQQIGIVIEGE